MMRHLSQLLACSLEAPRGPGSQEIGTMPDFLGIPELLPFFQALSARTGAVHLLADNVPVEAFFVGPVVSWTRLELPDGADGLEALGYDLP